MQNRENHVESARTNRSIWHRERRCHLHRQPGLDLDPAGIMGACEQPLLVLGDPTASLIDSNQNGLEPGSVQRFEDISGRQDRNLVLGRLTTEHDSHTDFPA